MNSKYTNLDVLRSLAVLSVVVQHFWRQCYFFHLIDFNPLINQIVGNISFTGVMFFFVHTCLVLMLSMQRSASPCLWRSFMIRRAFRIFPLCWATILLALSTGLSDQRGGNIASLGWQGVAANVLLLQNIANKFSSAIGPLWSLPWEMQMYLVLPVFFVILRKYDRLAVVFSFWLGATVLAVAVIRPGLPRMFHAALYPPMFIGGMVAYKLLSRRTSVQRFLKVPAGIWPFFVISLFTAQAFLMGRHEFESTPGIIIDSCVCLVLALAIPVFNEMSLPWIVRPAQEIAKYSYGVYLLHVPALIFVLRYLPGLSLFMKVVAFLFLTALMAVGSYHVIEDPLIRFGKTLATRLADSAAPSFIRPPEIA